MCVTQAFATEAHCQPQSKYRVFHATYIRADADPMCLYLIAFGICTRARHSPLMGIYLYCGGFANLVLCPFPFATHSTPIVRICFGINFFLLLLLSHRLMFSWIWLNFRAHHVVSMIQDLVNERINSDPAYSTLHHAQHWDVRMQNYHFIVLCQWAPAAAAAVAVAVTVLVIICFVGVAFLLLPLGGRSSCRFSKHESDYINATSMLCGYFCFVFFSYGFHHFA